MSFGKKGEVSPALEPTLVANWCRLSSCWFQNQTQSFGKRKVVRVSLFWAQNWTMPYLLMFVTLLHLITLAMLFIATMEKVGTQIRGTVWFCVSQRVSVLLCVTRLISRWSPGGSGRAWRTRTCGTTVGLTTSRERGCAHPPKKPVRFHGLDFTLSGSKSGG